MIAELLDVDGDLLAGFAAGAESRYRTFPITGRPGKRRWIHAPDPELKHVQRALLHRLLYRMPVHDAAHGFVPGRSVVTNASVHVGREVVVALDIRDFFPSTMTDSVRRALLEEGGDLSGADLEVLLDLVCLEGSLPQGAPTSPCLANLAVRPLDDALTALAGSIGYRYTRYADDLTFSGDGPPRDLVSGVAEVLDDHDYRLASRKTRVMRRHVRQEVTGLVVNDAIRPPRPFRRRLRAILHDVRKNGLGIALARAGLDSADALGGHLSWLAMTAPDQAEREIAALKEAFS